MIANCVVRCIIAATYLLLGGAMFRLQAYLSVLFIAISLALILGGGNKFLDKLKKRDRVIAGVVSLVISLLLLAD